MIDEPKPLTLRQAISSARDALAYVPELVPTASQDAELLLLQALSSPRSTLYAHPERLLHPSEQATFAAAVARRLRHEPIQYILGHQEFYGLSLTVTPPVLIPRPETELLVEALLERLPANEPIRMADIGAGSGAICIALAVHLPLAAIAAIDISPEALAVAAANAATHGVSDRISFLEGDLLAPLTGKAEPFHAIVSNPPYVPESERSSLHPQVRDFEPAGALFAGSDGLEIYQRLIPQAAEHLAPAGLLALEIGMGQQQALSRLLQDWQAVEFLDDLRGIPRVALARRP